MSGSVSVVLDTVAPVLTVEAEPYVDPPADWVVRVSASEDIGIASAALLDSRSVLAPLGLEHLDARTLLIRVPTAGISGGPATLLLYVTDSVLNAIQRSVPVGVARVEAYDVVLTMGKAYSVNVEVTSAYDTGLDLSPAYSILMEVS